MFGITLWKWNIFLYSKRGQWFDIYMIQSELFWSWSKQLLSRSVPQIKRFVRIILVFHNRMWSAKTWRARAMQRTHSDLKHVFKSWHLPHVPGHSFQLYIRNLPFLRIARLSLSLYTYGVISNYHILSRSNFASKLCVSMTQFGTLSG